MLLANCFNTSKEGRLKIEIFRFDAEKIVYICLIFRVILILKLNLSGK